MRKRYQVKIYSGAGVYQKTQNPLTITNDVTFTSKINGGQGQCEIDLDLPIDDFDEGATIDHFNFAKVYEVDDTNHTSPILIFTGFISRYTPYFSGEKEGVRLTLLGLSSLLSLAYYKNGASFTVSHAAVDPSAVATAVIDHFNTVYSGSWLSHGSNIDTVGTNITKDFVDKTWLQAMAEAIALADTGFWWHIGADGELYFKDKPASATHIFTLGKDVEAAEIKKDNEPIINALTLRWGGSPTVATYSDATSISDYGRREKIVSDSGVGDATTADQYGDKKIADEKDPKVSARVVINSNYDLESVRPGHTCTILNAKTGGNPFPENLLITSVAYSPDKVTLTLDKVRGALNQELADAISAAA